MAQKTNVPECFCQKINKNSQYIGLYLAEIENDTLYYLKAQQLPGADRINIAVFYNDNCIKVNTSAMGGITGKPNKYKPFKIIKTLWEKELPHKKTPL